MTLTFCAKMPSFKISQKNELFCIFITLLGAVIMLKKQSKSIFSNLIVGNILFNNKLSLFKPKSLTIVNLST